MGYAPARACFTIRPTTDRLAPASPLRSSASAWWIFRTERSVVRASCSTRATTDASTTKVEAYNGFTEWVRFGGESIPTGDPVEREKRVKYTDLVASAIMLQNVVDMSDALGSLVAEGWAVTPGQVARLSPYGTARVKRFGEYVLDMDGAPPPLTPRPLGLTEELTAL